MLGRSGQVFVWGHENVDLPGRYSNLTGQLERVRRVIAVAHPVENRVLVDVPLQGRRHGGLAPATAPLAFRVVRSRQHGGSAREPIP